MSIIQDSYSNATVKEIRKKTIRLCDWTILSFSAKKSIDTIANVALVDWYNL